MKYFIFSLIFFIFNISSSQELYLLKDEKDAISARLKLIELAQYSIKIQIFEFDDDTLTQALIYSLLKQVKDKPKLKVEILIDSHHNRLNKFILSIMNGSLDKNLINKIKIKNYNSFSLLNPLRYLKRMHDKLTIIDDQYFIIGGRNLSSKYFMLPDLNILKYYDDTDVLIAHSSEIYSAIHYFDALFSNEKFSQEINLIYLNAEYILFYNCDNDIEAIKCHNDKSANLYYLNKYIKLLESSYNRTINFFGYNNNFSLSHLFKYSNFELKFFNDSPDQQDENLNKGTINTGDLIYDELLNTKKEVVIVTPYFVLTKKHLELFNKLKSNNVKITIITNSKITNNQPVAHIGYIKTKQLAEKSGVIFREYQDNNTLHAKLVFIDNKKIFVGTYNWDLLSQFNNRELGVVIDFENENDFIKFSQQTKEYYWNNSKSVTNTVHKDQYNLDLKEKNNISNNDSDFSHIFWKLLYPILEDLNLP